MKAKLTILAGMSYLFLNTAAGFVGAQDRIIQVNEADLGFAIPNFSQFMGFLIKFFFVLAGLLALFYMLWGALSWVTSGGDEGETGKARKKIVAAVIGVILIVATLSIIIALEQVVFKGAICFGISCPLSLPSIIQKTADSAVDLDNDNINNEADYDMDGDNLCDDGDGTRHEKVNPGKEKDWCEGDDSNDDADAANDTKDNFPRDHDRS